MVRDVRNGDARRLAAEARLHLLKLLHGNSHAETVPAQAKRQKQKRRRAGATAS